MTAPRAASSSETVDLPAPIPPVSPTRSNSGGLGRRRVVRGRRVDRRRRLGRGLACSGRFRRSRRVALGGGCSLLGRGTDVLALLVEGVLAEMLAVLGRDLAALGRLLDRQRDAPPVEVDVDDL